MSETKRWYHRIGPGIIVAAVVLGPGSIVASSKAGAHSEYGLIWMLLAACIFMATYTSMAARVGCMLPESFLQHIATLWGRPIAIIVGLSAFFVATGFQFGNNIGVSVAMQGLIPDLPAVIWPIVFTVVSCIFLFKAQNMYELLEGLMRGLVICMLIAFVCNLFFTGVSPVGIAKGLVPDGFAEGEFVIAAGMLGTTFSAVAAFYQAYLVQAKGWQKENIDDAIKDAWIGIGILASIALIIMIGAAESLYGTEGGFKNIGELANQLKGILGNAAGVVFSLGLAAAAFSSFIANTMIGGTLLADGLGKDAHITAKATRYCAIASLVIGCIVAVGTITAGVGSAESVLIAQSSTLLASPLCAILVLYFANNSALMGDLKNKWLSNLIGFVGLVILFYLATRTFSTVAGKLSAMVGG